MGSKLGDRLNSKEHWLVINRKVTTRNLRKLCRLEGARQRQTVRPEILGAKTKILDCFIGLSTSEGEVQKNCVNELLVGKKVFSTPSEIQEGFWEHFKKLATPNDDPCFGKGYSDLVQLELRETQELCHRSSSNDKQITLDQVKKAILSLNRGKSADIYA